MNPGLLSPHFDRHARPRAGLGAREGALEPLDEPLELTEMSWESWE